jgi:hypothetical protein
MKKDFGSIGSELPFTTDANALQTAFFVSAAVVPPATQREI